jgi:hypothetical protein
MSVLRVKNVGAPKIEWNRTWMIVHRGWIEGFLAAILLTPESIINANQGRNEAI